MKIEPPKDHKNADYKRAAMKGAIGTIPLAGSILAEAANFILPDPTADDRKRWEGEITDGQNSLSELISSAQRSDINEVIISGAAAEIAKFMIENCTDGLAQNYVSIDDILSTFSDLDQQQGSAGFGELESLGLIENEACFGGHDQFCLTGQGYEALDPHVMGWSPRDDAKVLVGLLNNANNGVDVSELFQSTGWSKRRFNPALRVVISYISYDCISRERSMNFVTSSFSASNAELASLKRFASK